MSSPYNSHFQLGANKPKSAFVKLVDWASVGKHHIYKFDEASAADRNLLGVKAANICEMVRLKLPVPPGFVMSTETCKEFFQHLEKKKRITKQCRKSIRYIERATNKEFALTRESAVKNGSESSDDEVMPHNIHPPHNHKTETMERTWPLLLSVRASTTESMPGMLDSVLNLGINDEIVEILAQVSGDEHWAYDTYRIFIQMYGTAVMQKDHCEYEKILAKKREERGIETDAEFSVSDLKEIIAEFKTVAPVHQDPWQQLINTIYAVVYSWYSPRAVAYREAHNISADLGTAVVVQSMVFGNKNRMSGSGVALTRNPTTGAREYYGEYLALGSGCDVVRGTKRPQPLHVLRDQHLNAYDQLLHSMDKLEHHFKDAMNLEFAVEDGQLYALQCRKAKLTSAAALHVAVSMVREQRISEKEALMRIDPDQMSVFLHKRIDPQCLNDPETKDAFLGCGQAASAGLATGKLVFGSCAAEKCLKIGESYILCKTDCSLDDFKALKGAAGFLSVRGGLTAHAAVHMRTMDIPAVTAASDTLRVDLNKRTLCTTDGDVAVKEGEIITIDGNSGSVFRGEIPSIEAGQDQYFSTLLFWADKHKAMDVRAAVSSKRDLQMARDCGAEGIGILQTEFMFHSENCLELFRTVLLSEDAEQRQKCLREILAEQREDFANIFTAVDTGVVKIRLLDAPLASFLPNPSSEGYKDEVASLARALHLSEEECLQKIWFLQEDAPLLGLRGTRLAVVYPEIATMQVTAIAGAVFDAKKHGTPVTPSIILPQIYSDHELDYLIPQIQHTLTLLCDEVVQSMKFLNISLKFLNISMGAEVNFPRAVTRMEKIVTTQGLDFVSFDTDELTEMMFGMDRHDDQNIVPRYVNASILRSDPFAVMDVATVGPMLQTAIRCCREARDDAVVDVHGALCSVVNSVRFLSHLGFSALSCSPVRVPVAKLAAAQAKIHSEHLKHNGHHHKEQDDFWNYLSALPTATPKRQQQQQHHKTQK